MIFVYRILAAPLLIIGFLFLSLFSKKIRLGLRDRLKVLTYPVFSEPPFWIHAASGEFEYAKPLIRELKAKFPKIPIVVTYFSPTFRSAIAKTPGVDFALPLPFDLPGPIQNFLKIFKPKALLIARTDLWPEVLYQTKLANIPRILFSARQTSTGGFLNRAKASLFNQLTAIFCVSETDANNFRKLNTHVPVQAIGDTRYDQVIYRLDTATDIALGKKPHPQPWLIAGSTWPEDERVLYEALTPLVLDKKLKLILVPHEPTESHIKQIESQLKNKKLDFQMYSENKDFTAQVLLVDRVGRLAELYMVADLAFVGGSFRKSVHSVMEPLAAGLVTIVGPHFQNNREALDFIETPLSDGSFAVKVANDATEFRGLVAEFEKPNSLIRNEILNRAGATERLLHQIKIHCPLLQSQESL